MSEFLVKQGDVVDVPSDLLLLKYAQAFYGADKTVAARLTLGQVCSQEDIEPAPGSFFVVETRGVIAPKRVMFLGTPPLRSFTYNEMESFARRSLEIVNDLQLPVYDVTTTVHGIGYGLDGGESLQRMISGFQAGLKIFESIPIERITFLTLDKRTERMLQAALSGSLVQPRGTEANEPKRYRLPVSGQGHRESKTAIPRNDLGSVDVTSVDSSVRKKRVFVALPFSEEFQNVYEFGIYPAVRNCGFICERVDETHFTGDVLTRIKGGIEAADLVIADLTEGRPNVYLEVGYAWGRSVPVIFVAKKGEKLHFDVSTHRCIFYGKFSKFALELEELIRGIDAKQKS
jgi:hypothetical protein